VASPRFVVYGGPVADLFATVDVSVQAPSSYGTVKVTARRSDTGTVTVLYDGPIDADDRVDLDYTPLVNTRFTLEATAQHPSQCGGYGSGTFTRDLSTRSAVDLFEPTRVGSRTYTFRGNDNGHARDVVDLYREDQYGRPVLSGRTTSDAQGNYEIRRTFTGTGTFVFSTSTPSDPINAGDVSTRYRVTVR
jgi:hypothetical protein